MFLRGFFQGLLLVFGAMLVAVPFALGVDPQVKTKQEIFESVEKQFGPIIVPESAPILYEILDRSFDRVAAASNIFKDPRYLHKATLQVIESGEPNAFVISTRDPGL